MAMTDKEKRIFERGRETRETKAESKAGMYEGGGLGQANGREMAKRVKAEDKKDAQKYGGMDMPSKEQQGKAYGGKVKKMADGGKISVKTKKEMRETTSKAAKVAEAKKKEQQMKKFVAGKAQERKENKRKRELADKVYKDAYKKYQEEENNPNSRFPNADKALYRVGDKVGDVARKIGKKFGSNRVTSQDDEAQMQARKDVKGFKEGGKVKKMAHGGSVGRGDGCAQRGRTKGRMV